jgi:hypothetical protein
VTVAAYDGYSIHCIGGGICINQLSASSYNMSLSQHALSAAFTFFALQNFLHD